jgi:hypothetical protein
MTRLRLIFAACSLALAAWCVCSPAPLWAGPNPSGLTTEALADANKKMADYDARITKLRESKSETVQLFLPSAEYLLVSLRNFLDPAPWEAANGQPLISPADDERYGKGGRIVFVKRIFDELDKIVPELEAGRNPCVKYPGHTLIAYRSPLDGRLLAMRVTIPARLDPEKTSALNYCNSSSGGATGNVQRPLYVREGGASPGDTISAVVSDRGECHYGNDIHEEEALEAIAMMSRMFKIDSNRIYKTGGSKDGYTSVSIGMHYPHLFAAVYGQAANSLPDGSVDSKALPPLWPLRDQMNAWLMAENLYDLPSAIVTGFDGDHTNTLMMRALLEKVNAPEKIIRVEPEGGHGTTKWTDDEVNKWMPAKVLNPYPKRVHVSTNSLRYNRFYWVEVDALEHENRFARMRVDSLDGNRIEAETRNVARFSLVTLDKVLDAGVAVTVEIDDQLVKGLAAKDGRLSFAKVNGKWSAAPQRTDAGLVKKHGLSGPMMDAWIHPSLHVIGTLGTEAEMARLREMMLTEVRAWRSETCGFRRVDHPVKLDTQVTPEDIRDRNLILWGNDRTNAIIRRINAKLPVRLDGNKVIVGGKTCDYDDVALALIYPNPLNPERYACVFSGNVWMAIENLWVSQWSEDKATKTVNYFKIGGGYPMLPDYLVFRQNRKGLAPGWGSAWGKVDISVLEGGFFDGHWQLTEDDAFAWKNPMPQTNAPLFVPKAVGGGF